MNLIAILQRHYFFKLMLHLGGLAMVYKYIAYLRKKILLIEQQQKRLRNEATINIESIRKQFPIDNNSTLVQFRQQAVAGIARQEGEQFFQVKGEHNPKLFAIREPFSKSKIVPYFSIVDLQQDQNQTTDKIYIHPSFDFFIDKPIVQKFNYENKKKESKWKFIKTFTNLFNFKLNYKGVAFGSPIYLIGDFVLNKENGIIRCYRVSQMGNQQSLMKDLKKIRIQIFIIMMGSFFTGFLLLVRLIKLHKYSKNTCNRLPLNFAEISKGNDTFKCEKCKKNYIDLIFLPCGHFNFCSDCGNNIEICPKCRQDIEDVVKIYKS